MTKLFIEADSIAKSKMSGVGHATLGMIRAFDQMAETHPELSVTVVVPFGSQKIIRSYDFKRVQIRRLGPAHKYLNYLLVRTGLPIPVDLWFGSGVYIFPNYKTWFTPFSQSLTFVHDLAFKSYPKTVSPKNLIYLQKNFGRWLKRANKILCISEQTAKTVSRYYPNYTKKTEVVYLGFDNSVYYRRPEDEIRRVLAKYDLPRHYFLSIGNLEPRKNIEFLLDVYKQYCDLQKTPKALVLVGGDGWNNQSIKLKIKELKSSGYKVIQPKRYVPDADLPALYSGAVSLVHLAIDEGFGLPPVEAQACGTPVIASDIAVFRETLPKTQTTFVSIANHKEAAAALAKPKTPQDNPEARFTWSNTVQQILSVIAKMNKKSEVVV